MLGFLLTMTRFLAYAGILLASNSHDVFSLLARVLDEDFQRQAQVTQQMIEEKKKKAEEERSQSEEKQQALLRAIHEGWPKMSISLSQQLEQVHTSRREEPEANSRPLRQRLTGELGGHSSAGSQDDLPRANFQAEERYQPPHRRNGVASRHVAGFNGRQEVRAFTPHHFFARTKPKTNPNLYVQEANVPADGSGDQEEGQFSKCATTVLDLSKTEDY